jgi:hypothetical protein
MTDERRPIEPLIRDEAVPDDTVVVIRGGPIAAEKIVEHALRQRALFTYRGEPMIAISTYLTVSGWNVERILHQLMRSRSRYATALVGGLRTSGYEFVPTGRVPHFSLTLPAATFGEAAALLAHFGPTLENPYRGRR